MKNGVKESPKETADLWTVARAAYELRKVGCTVAVSATPVGERGQQERVDITFLHTRTGAIGEITATGTKGGAFVPKARVLGNFQAALR